MNLRMHQGGSPCSWMGSGKRRGWSPTACGISVGPGQVKEINCVGGIIGHDHLIPTPGGGTGGTSNAPGVADPESYRSALWYQTRRRPAARVTPEQQCHGGDIMSRHAYQGNGRFKTLGCFLQETPSLVGVLSWVPDAPWALGFSAVWHFVSWEQVSSRHSVHSSDVFCQPVIQAC